jgi:adenylate cyclase
MLPLKKYAVPACFCATVPDAGCRMPEGAMSETRKIAAILVSDVVGYSRLAGADEDRTLARLRALRSDLIDPTIAVHHGRVVKRTGDGSLVEFRSVVDAVRCAIDVQIGLAERNAGLPPDRRIEFRVGIHLGDVVEEADGDLMGDGVNIAARLEGVAKPGAICLSEDAYRQVSGRLDMEVTDLGPIQLKNIERSIRVYSLRVGVPAQAKPATKAKPPEPKKHPMLALLGAGIAALIVIGSGVWYFVPPSRTATNALNAPAAPKAAHLSIVVLPFENLSGDANQDYFADSITDNLTTDLARIRGSFVIARNTAFTYKGKNVDAKEIGKELGVRYVLEGSAQRDQNRGRVNAQLIDADSGAHLWAERFEEDLTDLFKLQDQVVARLANTLGLELVKAEAEKSAHSRSPDVVDLDMRGWVMLQQWLGTTKDYISAARVWFEQALKIDPNDPDALAGAAYTHFQDFALGWPNPEIDYEAKVLGQADRAIALAHDNLWAYYVKANYLALTKRANEAVASADAGLAIDPNFVQLYVARALAENFLGRFEQAISDVQHAMRLSPHDPEVGVWRGLLGMAELGQQHYDAAVDEEHRAIDGGFRPFYVYSDLAAAYALSGKMDQAKTALAESRRLNPKLTVKWLIALGVNDPIKLEAYRKAGLPEE